MSIFGRWLWPALATVTAIASDPQKIRYVRRWVAERTTERNFVREIVQYHWFSQARKLQASWFHGASGGRDSALDARTQRRRPSQELRTNKLTPPVVSRYRPYTMRIPFTDVSCRNICACVARDIRSALSESQWISSATEPSKLKALPLSSGRCWFDGRIET